MIIALSLFFHYATYSIVCCPFLLFLITVGKGLFHKAAQEQVKLILNYSSGLLRSCFTGIFIALTNTEIIMCASYSIQEVVANMKTFLHTQGYFKHCTAKVAHSQP